MVVMDCVAGHARTPDGEPITILTLAHLDEIEQPMLLTLDDTERLVIKCLESLATAKDSFAAYILQRYFGADEIKNPPHTDPDGTDDDDDDDPFEAWKKA